MRPGELILKPSFAQQLRQLGLLQYGLRVAMRFGGLLLGLGLVEARGRGRPRGRPHGRKVPSCHPWRRYGISNN